MKKSMSIIRRAVAVAILFGGMWPVSAALTHRYSFTSNANDSVGTAHGTAVSTPNGVVPTFSGGRVELDGAGGYIDLPNGLFSSLTSVTIEAWVTVNVNPSWSRIFDFGTSTTGDTQPGQAIGTGIDYMFLTPNGAGSGNARFAITDTDQAVTGGERPVLNDPDDFPVGEEVHVAVVYGPPVARLYVNGRLASSGTAVIPLSALQDVNNWLGRSQWNDPFFSGLYNEFRIHDSLVGGPEIKASQLGGPDATNYDPGTVSALTITADRAMAVGGAQTPVVSATFSAAGQITLSPGEMTLSSSATNIVAVTAAGALQATGIGTATITAARGGQSATVVITVSPASPAVLKHRYSFDGPVTSTSVVDSVGAQNGEIRPPFPTAGVPNPLPVILTNGQALFPSGTAWDSAGYIDLPNGLISSKTNITIETWVTWNGPNNNGSQNWSRIFDFGDSSKGEDAQFAGNGSGRGYIMLTPRANGNTLRFEAVPAGGTAMQLNTSPTIVVGQEIHLVVVYAPTLKASQLYVNGALAASGTAAFPLSQLTDINNWLGASQWQGDLPYFGLINEFRIYEGPLTDIEVALSRNAGPNALSAAPGTLQSVALTAVPALFLGNPTATQAASIANFQNTTNVNVTTVGGITFASSNTNVFTVNATGALLARGSGAASLISTFRGLSATTAVSVTAPIALRHDISTNKLNAGGVLVAATLRADFPSQTNVNVNGYTGVTRASSNTNVLTIAANGNITAITAGSATITSTFSGLTAQTDLTVVFPAGYKPGQLVHRYSFNGAPGTTTVTDSVGTAHGDVVGIDGAANDFNGSGQLSLGGSAWNASPLGAYVNLPNGIVSTLSSVTLEGWANYRGGANNQRFFDFGISTAADGSFIEDEIGARGRSYMFLTPAAGPRFAINQGTAGESPSITSSTALTLNTNSHFAVVYDPTNGVARLYINGRRTGTGAAAQPLSTVDDRNAWLGRSVWQDPLLNAVYDEFRMYNGPLSDSDIAASFAAGPNSLITPGQNEPNIPTGPPKGNIIWVSFHGDDKTPSAAATTAGFTQAADAGYTQLLRSSGYNVTRFVTTGTPNTNLLNAANLVIISRSVPSGDYELDAETAAWNGLTAPTMILGGYILRSSRLGFTTGTTIPDTATNAPVILTVNNTAHPIFAGIALGAGNTMINPYANSVSFNNTVQRGISVNTDPLAGGGVRLASIASTATSAGGGMVIGEWQAGATMATSPADKLGGHRLVFLTGSRENDGLTSEGSGIYDLAPDGAKLFLNAVDYMIKPPAPAEARFTAFRRNADGTLTIEWTGGGTLEAAPAITGPWAPVTGATSPYTFTPTATMLFGRIRL